MTVCLHCGSLAEEGALFCTKCGYTLPQPGLPVGPTLPSTLPPSFVRAPAPPQAPPTGAPPTLAGPPPRPCARCNALISPAAVYCPVCQSPQPP